MKPAQRCWIGAPEGTRSSLGAVAGISGMTKVLQMGLRENLASKKLKKKNAPVKMALTMFILTLGGFWRSWSLSLSFQGKENGKFLTWENLPLRNVSALLDNPSL